MMKSIILEILLYLLLVLAQIGLAALTVFVKKKIEYYNARISYEQRGNLQYLVKTLVKAAEVMFKNGNGEAKREYVMKFLTQKLKLDEATARAFLEEAIHELKWLGEEWQDINKKDVEKGN